MMKKNLLVLGIVAIVCAAVLIVGLALNRGGAPLLPPSAAGDNGGATADKPLYLVVTVGDTVHEPILLTGEAEYSYLQEDTGASNTVWVTAEGIAMHSSTCKNQDCVKQGEVTLANRDTRVLGSMIICLPNRVTLELRTEDELSQKIILE